MLKEGNEDSYRSILEGYFVVVTFMWCPYTPRIISEWHQHHKITILPAITTVLHVPTSHKKITWTHKAPNVSFQNKM